MVATSQHLIFFTSIFSSVTNLKIYLIHFCHYYWITTKPWWRTTALEPEFATISKQIQIIVVIILVIDQFKIKKVTQIHQLVLS